MRTVSQHVCSSMQALRPEMASPVTSERLHAPAVGITRRLLGRFHVTGVFWYRFPHWAFTRLPARVEAPSVAVFTAFFFLTLTRIRAAVAANLEPVLGKASRLERWLALDPAVQAETRASLTATAARLWSWEGVARGILAASAGDLSGLPAVPDQ